MVKGPRGLNPNKECSRCITTLHKNDTIAPFPTRVPISAVSAVETVVKAVAHATVIVAAEAKLGVKF